MHRHLRVVGARLDAEVAVRAELVEVVAREVRQLLERRGPPVGEAEPVLAVLVDEQRRPEAERDRQPGRRQPDRLAGVVGRQVVGALERADRVRRSRPGSSARRPRSRPSAARPGRRASDVVTSNAAKCSRSWAGGGDPGLVLAAERVGAVAPAAPASVAASSRASAYGARTRRPDPDGRGSTAADQAASGDRASGHGQATTTAVSWDSGSDSALTASASCLISSWVRSS